VDFKHILITGGAGFIGSNLAVRFKESFRDCRITVLDNLKRRGSELNLPRLQSMGVQFVHGDVRSPEDFYSVSGFDCLIDCAAEPSVHAGTSGSNEYVINTNLMGTVHSLEAARRANAAFVLLSTSRVFPIERLNNIPYRESETRFYWDTSKSINGLDDQGISEEFSLDGARSFYGASKLSAELMVREYAYQWKMPAIVNRCGVLAGAWQMGSSDQGVVTHWVARHLFQKPLKYIGFGGCGKQVRDLLHVDDLFDLLVSQSANMKKWDGQSYNIGGGRDISVSLAELTNMCQEITGQRVPIDRVANTREVDIRIYLTDSRKARNDFSWKPTRDVHCILTDISNWIGQNATLLAPILG